MQFSMQVDKRRRDAEKSLDDLKGMNIILHNDIHLAHEHTLIQSYIFLI